MATKPKAKSKSPAKASGKARRPASSAKRRESTRSASAAGGKGTRRAGSSAHAARKPATAKKAARPAPKASRPTSTTPPKPGKPTPTAKPAPAAERAKAAQAPGKTAAAPSAKRAGDGKAPPATAPGKGTPPPASGKGEGRPASRKASRSRGSGLRRGSNGELFKPGDVLVPGGVQTFEEIQYLFRGCAAAERPSPETGIAEVLAHVPATGGEGGRDPEVLRAELQRHLDAALERFDSGRLEASLPNRSAVSRRGFPDVVDRARARRREIGAFLRGLDLGRTETSHMDSHGEASLQSLMEWAARLEIVADADEHEQADYAQLHRGLDHSENITETLIIDVEQTLRRLRDHTRAS